MKKPNRYILPAITALLFVVLVIVAIARDHPPGEIRVQKSPQGESASRGYRININHATAEELEQLPGIGPVLAKRIVDYRNKHGTFKNIFDLKNVPGISEEIYNGLKSYITVR